MIRLLDMSVSVLGLVAAGPLLFILWGLVWLDVGSPIFQQQRVGRYQRPFTLMKFRTMHSNTISVPSHLVEASAITPLGRFLRRTKLDELPQLLNVLLGDMSLVGPRPCLTTQTQLITARRRLGVFSIRPGITGLSQISGIDMSNPEKLAVVDARMIDNLCLRYYLKILLLTILGRGYGDRVNGSTN